METEVMTVREWHVPDRLHPIYADLAKQDAHGNVPLTTVGTRRDLERFGVVLSNGQRLYFYDLDENDNGEADDLFVAGTVRWDGELGHWSAEIDGKEILHASEVDFSQIPGS